MRYFPVRYDSRAVNYDHRGFIRLATVLLSIFRQRQRFLYRQNTMEIDKEQNQQPWRQSHKNSSIVITLFWIGCYKSLVGFWPITVLIPPLTWDQVRVNILFGQWYSVVRSYLTSMNETSNPSFSFFNKTFRYFYLMIISTVCSYRWKVMTALIGQVQ